MILPPFIYLFLDIDECSVGTASCDVNSICMNTRGSYNCQCKDGYTKNENGQCIGKRGRGRCYCVLLSKTKWFYAKISVIVNWCIS